MQIVSAFKEKPKKKKILLLAVLSVILVFCIASGYLLAYVTKPMEARINNVTVGDIKIELKEEEWDKLPDDERLVYPGKELPKDPVIKNVSNSESDAYIFAKISVPYKNVRIANGDAILPAVGTDLFAFTLGTGWVQLGAPQVSADGSANEYVCFYNTPLAKGDSAPAVFESVRFANVLEGELEMNEKLEIEIDALAIQKDYAPLNGGTLAEQMKNLYDNYLKDT